MGVNAPTPTQVPTDLSDTPNPIMGVDRVSAVCLYVCMCVCVCVRVCVCVLGE